MDFHANYVSTSVFGDGDCYQATFEAEQDTDDPDSPYLLIQGNSKIQMTIDATSKRMTKTTAVIFYCAASISRPQKLSIELEEEQFCQCSLCDGGDGVRRGITGRKDH